MTVLTNDTVERYTISGVGPYPFNFRIFAESNIAASVLSAASLPVATLLSYPGDYTVVVSNVATGGTVTLTPGVAATYAGYTLDIRSNTTINQPTSIRNIGRFLPEIHEDAFDNLSRQIQDLARKVRASFRYPDNVLTDGTLTPLEAWASKYIAISAAGVLEPALLSSSTLTPSVITALLASSPAEQTAIVALLVGDIAATSTSQALLSSLALTEAESFYPGKVVNYSYEGGNVLRYGADPTGVLDSSDAIQDAINMGWAAGFFNTPWSGMGGAFPVIIFPPGRYRITKSLIVPTGVTLRGTGQPSHTTSHTRIIMDSTTYSPPDGAGDNRNKPILKFNRWTYNNAAEMNSVITSSIQELEFWYVTPGGTFNLPHSTGFTFGDYPDGGTICFDVDAGDFRVINCVFQHGPAAVRIKNVSLTPATRGDGHTGNRGVGVFFEGCEFDASTSSHIYATNSYCYLVFKNCQFYSGQHRYEGCTGKLVYLGGNWQGGAYINAETVGNTFDAVIVKGAEVEPPSNAPWISLSKSTLVDISENTINTAATRGGIQVWDADGGRICDNLLHDQGFNAPAGTGISDFSAAIKGRGLRNVLVSGNSITCSGLASYNGFGILLGDSARASQTNFVNNNAVTVPFNAATYLGQSRYINVAAGDVIGINYVSYDTVNASIIGSGLWARKRFSGVVTVPTYGTTITIDSSLGNKFDILVTNAVGFTVSSPINTVSGAVQRITISVFNSSGGVMGAITWGAGYKLAAWTNPANGFNRSIDFEFDGSTTWREVSRTPADVPN